MNVNASSLSCRKAARLFVFTAALVMTIAPVALSQTPDASPESRPIPLGWKIVIVAAVCAAIGTAIFYLVRTWRSWNLFDRQYRFPHVADAPRRLGANKSGGLLATIVFNGPADPASPRSGAKDL